jgi:hypothetical protein
VKENVQGDYGSPDAKNRRVVVTRHGGPEVLRVVEEALPEPGGGEVRVKVLAAGVSAYDLMHRRSGALPGSPRVPFTLGEDLVGVVDKLDMVVVTTADPFWLEHNDESWKHEKATISLVADFIASLPGE